MSVIHGVNDNPDHFETAAKLVKHTKSLVRVDVLPYQPAAGAKYEMVGMTYVPDFEDGRSPNFYTDIFEREGLPFRQFR